MRVLLFCGKSTSSEIVLGYLKDKYNLVGVVSENPPSKKRMVRKRIKRLGFFTVMLQLIFMKLMVPCIQLFSEQRKKEILATLPRNPIGNDNFTLLVDSINSTIVLDFVKNRKPDVIVVNGTRIIVKRILEKITVPILNIHVGITPKYRGVHGGYWALVNRDEENFGVTVHYVDSGIDTGGVICKGLVSTTKRDSFVTYPFLQLKKGLECLEEALLKISRNDRSIIDTSSSESKLYFHPTITQYLYYRISKGIK